MELKVYEKLLEWRRKGTAVSVGRLQEWSREFMKLLYPDKKWKGSQRWSERFRRRWNLSVRMKTRVAQKTAAHVADQCKSFWQFVRAKRRERGIDTAWIINADQTPLWLEMPTTTTVEETGVRLVPIRSAGYQKQRVTVMLACTADRRKLKPWVFFKRKTLPKGDFPADVAVACHENGWMDSPGVVRWLEECVKPFLKPRFGRYAKSSMLVLDSYRGHLTEEVKEKLREMNCVPAIIPSGCTAEVQPLDVCINKSFKASVRQQPSRCPLQPARCPCSPRAAPTARAPPLAAHAPPLQPARRPCSPLAARLRPARCPCSPLAARLRPPRCPLQPAGRPLAAHSPPLVAHAPPSGSPLAAPCSPRAALWQSARRPLRPCATMLPCLRRPAALLAPPCLRRPAVRSPNGRRPLARAALLLPALLCAALLPALLCAALLAALLCAALLAALAVRSPALPCALP
ncbi:unnamed protein product [Closterium sp. NIES-54]